MLDDQRRWATISSTHNGLLATDVDELRHTVTAGLASLNVDFEEKTWFPLPLTRKFLRFQKDVANFAASALTKHGGPVHRRNTSRRQFLKIVELYIALTVTFVNMITYKDTGVRRSMQVARDELDDRDEATVGSGALFYTKDPLGDKNDLQG